MPNNDMITESLQTNTLPVQAPAETSRPGHNVDSMEQRIMEGRRRLQEEYMAVTPIIDKDAIEEKLESVREKLGSENSHLIERAQSGHPVETVLALSKIQSLISPTHAEDYSVSGHEFAEKDVPKVEIIRFDHRDLPKIDISGEKGPAVSNPKKSTLFNHLMGRVTGLYQDVFEGRLRGMKYRDVDDLAQRLKKGDTDAMKDALKITQQIDRKLGRKPIEVS